MAGGHDTAHELIRSYVERIELLEGEIRERNGDKSDLYKEAKALGLDPKVLRKVIAHRRKDESAVQEEDALFDLYMRALGTPIAMRACTTLPATVVIRPARMASPSAGDAGSTETAARSVEPNHSEMPAVLDSPAAGEGGRVGELLARCSDGSEPNRPTPNSAYSISTGDERVDTEIGDGSVSPFDGGEQTRFPPNDSAGPSGSAILEDDNSNAAGLSVREGDGTAGDRNPAHVPSPASGLTRDAPAAFTYPDLPDFLKRSPSTPLGAAREQLASNSAEASLQ